MFITKVWCILKVFHIRWTKRENLQALTSSMTQRHPTQLSVFSIPNKAVHDLMEFNTLNNTEVSSAQIIFDLYVFYISIPLKLDWQYYFVLTVSMENNILKNNVCNVLQLGVADIIFVWVCLNQFLNSQCFFCFMFRLVYASQVFKCFIIVII